MTKNLKRIAIALIAVTSAFMTTACKEKVKPEEIREGEVIVKELEAGKLAEVLAAEKTNPIKYLTFVGGTVKQKDIKAMSALPSLEEVNLSKSTLEIIGMDNGFKDNKTIKRIIAPANLEEVPFGCFAYMANLEEVTLPGNTKIIGGGAFCMSPKLKKVMLPASVELIDADAFYGDKALEEITIPDRVKMIPANCFLYCTGLKTVTLPKALVSLGDQAFAGCSALKTIYFRNTTPPVFEKDPDTQDTTYPFSGITWLKEGKPFIQLMVPTGKKSDYIKAWGFDETKDGNYFQEYTLSK